MRPIRILHVVQHLKGGGAETFVRGLTAGLRRRRELDVRILSIYPDGLDDDERTELGVPVASLERRGRGDLVTFYPRLIRAVASSRADVVHAHLHAGKYAGRIGAIASRVPAIVFTEHGDEASGLVRAAVNAMLHPRTARFVVFSESQRAAFARRESVPIDRVVAIPNGVAEPPAAGKSDVRAELGLPTDAFVAYLPARMASQKNHILALRAFARAFGSDASARLVLAGSGPLEPVIRREADRLDLTERVTFLGFRNDAPRLLRAMDVFLMPSLWERMPLALGEAMRGGIPAVLAPWNGHEDFVKNGVTGIVSTDWSVDAFARALGRTRDAATRARIATQARAFAADAFGLERSVQRHAALYEELVARGRARS